MIACTGMFREKEDSAWQSLARRVADTPGASSLPQVAWLCDLYGSGARVLPTTPLARLAGVVGYQEIGHLDRVSRWLEPPAPQRLPRLLPAKGGGGGRIESRDLTVRACSRGEGSDRRAAGAA